ncbi:hypothetical protein PTSG_07920 [Salpingoeca rosetta]|uniref:Endo-beta-1,2-glucanase SGL domain-containing protein n=1 Tax=Salpingoeca rosetta (strain ATCC 50818 / BSB-021) TaxID=946362 RepID=F2UGQ2_SALR5|nr:uncharacterized protein PTSG_07920 [Salpingoeca rosetta]EGD75802.1 hypothetical protein PTSG_07920 [Salpingoeca rosetta]|eukprot:XP_004991723.1 hypothetical protein PTSG_07920 [Salpingoeca rosetta]
MAGRTTLLAGMLVVVLLVVLLLVVLVAPPALASSSSSPSPSSWQCCDDGAKATLEQERHEALDGMRGDAAAAVPWCNFAQKYTTSELVNDAGRREQFIKDVMHAEGKFHQSGIAYHPVTAMTFDGHLIDYASGKLYPGGLHNFSSGAKDAQHLSILALGLDGQPRALAYLNSTLKQPVSIQDIQLHAMHLIDLKLTALEKWNASFPGYGGYLPWFSHTTNGDLVPAPGWSNPYRVPALDNGEFYWGLYAVEVALSTSSLPGAAPLAARCRRYLRLLQDNAATIFLTHDGKTRWVSEIVDVTTVPTRSNYRGSGDYGDPFEGELFTWVLYWHAPWSKLNLSRDDLFLHKHSSLQAVNFTTSTGQPITVQRGFWFSSHEQWKLLMLPYLHLQRVARVFANCERARTVNSAEKRIPGLYACINDVTNGSEAIPDYISYTGIPSIAMENSTMWRYDVVTPYAAFPTTLINETVGAAWYHTMLLPNRMQGPYGSTEAININGTEISPLLTWDAKSLTPLAFMGGVADVVAKGLRRDNLYSSFLNVTSSYYASAFATPLSGEHVPFALPTATAPTTPLSPFTACR